MGVGNDLEEHKVSNRAPSLRAATGNYHVQQKGRSPKFYPTPPLNARTYSFYTQNVAGNSRVLGMNARRRGLAVQNLSNQSVFLSVGSEAGFDGSSYTNAIEIPTNGFFEFPAGYAPINDVYAVSLTQGAHIVVIESIITGA